MLFWTVWRRRLSGWTGYSFRAEEQISLRTYEVFQPPATSSSSSIGRLHDVHHCHSRPPFALQNLQRVHQLVCHSVAFLDLFVVYDVLSRLCVPFMFANHRFRSVSRNRSMESRSKGGVRLGSYVGSISVRQSEA